MHQENIFSLARKPRDNPYEESQRASGRKLKIDVSTPQPPATPISPSARVFMGALALMNGPSLEEREADRRKKQQFAQELAAQAEEQRLRKAKEKQYYEQLDDPNISRNTRREHTSRPSQETMMGGWHQDNFQKHVQEGHQTQQNARIQQSPFGYSAQSPFSRETRAIQSPARGFMNALAEMQGRGEDVRRAEKIKKDQLKHDLEEQIRLKNKTKIEEEQRERRRVPSYAQYEPDNARRVKDPPNEFIEDSYRTIDIERKKEDRAQNYSNRQGNKIAQRTYDDLLDPQDKVNTVLQQIQQEREKLEQYDYDDLETEAQQKHKSAHILDSPSSDVAIENLKQLCKELLIEQKELRKQLESKNESVEHRVRHGRSSSTPAKRPQSDNSKPRSSNPKDKEKPLDKAEAAKRRAQIRKEYSNKGRSQSQREDSKSDISKANRRSSSPGMKAKVVKNTKLVQPSWEDENLKKGPRYDPNIDYKPRRTNRSDARSADTIRGVRPHPISQPGGKEESLMNLLRQGKRPSSNQGSLGPALEGNSRFVYLEDKMDVLDEMLSQSPHIHLPRIQNKNIQQMSPQSKARSKIRVGNPWKQDIN